MPVLILAEDPDKNLIPAQVDADGVLKVIAQDEIFEVTLSLDTNAYASGDVLAATQELDGAAFTENGGKAILQSLQVLDLDDQGQALDVLLLRSNVSIGTENSSVSVSDANADEIVAVVEVTADDYVDLVASQVAEIGNIGKLIEAAAADDALYIAAISRGTGTYTTAGIKIRVGLLR